MGREEGGKGERGEGERGGEGIHPEFLHLNAGKVFLHPYFL